MEVCGVDFECDIKKRKERKKKKKSSSSSILFKALDGMGQKKQILCARLLERLGVHWSWQKAKTKTFIT